MEVDKQALFPPVGPRHCQKLHPFIFMWWEENSHRDFLLTLIREKLARAGHEPRPSMPVWRPAPASTNIGRLDRRHDKHCHDRNTTKWRCGVCSARGVTRSVMFQCVKCDVRVVWTEIDLRITTQRTSYKTSFRLSSVPTDEASTTM